MSTNKDILLKKFLSIDKDHLIVINIIFNIAWFQIDKINYENCKTFILLIKDCVDYFKENNIEYVKQYIHTNDIEFFKFSDIININNDLHVATTPLINFVDELVSILGIKLI